MTQTHDDDDELNDDSARAETPIRTVKVGTAKRKHFTAKLRAGYFFGSGKEVIEGPAEVSIPIAPDPLKGTPGLRGYLHMIDNVREAEEVLGIPHRTFLDLQSEATESARRINAARARDAGITHGAAAAPGGIALTPDMLQSIIASAVQAGVSAALAQHQAAPTVTHTGPAPASDVVPPRLSGAAARSAARRT